MFLYRHRLRRRLGDGLIVWINPGRVDFHGGSNQPYTGHLKPTLLRLQEVSPLLRPASRFLDVALYSIEPFSVKARLLKNLMPIDAAPTYRKIADFIQNRTDPTRSLWYKTLVETLDRTGVATHKALVFRSEQEIRAFFDGYVGGLVDSMATRGYDREKVQDIGTALIGADGSILKSDAGNHRFSVARILGATPFPLEILGAHEAWVRDMKIGGDWSRLQACLRQVEAKHQ